MKCNIAVRSNDDVDRLIFIQTSILIRIRTDKRCCCEAKHPFPTRCVLHQFVSTWRLLYFFGTPIAMKLHRDDDGIYNTPREVDSARWWRRPTINATNARYRMLLPRWFVGGTARRRRHWMVGEFPQLQQQQQPTTVRNRGNFIIIKAASTCRHRGSGYCSELFFFCGIADWRLTICRRSTLPVDRSAGGR